ncbi:MAG TPA: menaquinone biosynthesis protein [Bacteroidales bacterium]|nr:menaquinone biosynthesis protein [Bacteroidales bacterium]
MSLPLKISAVSYLNTIPFVYGIQNSGILDNFRLFLDVPSVCAEKMKKGEVDISLVPVGAVREMEGKEIVTGYCIGAVRDVRTVVLLARKPLPEIRTVHLDFDSRTSVRLVKVLAEHFWKIDPSWEELPPGSALNADSFEALVAIGDKTFSLAPQFPYVYDLAGEWIKFSGLPFVFAVWMASPDVPMPVMDSFTRALEYGVRHRPEAVEFYKDKLPRGVDCLAYLQRNISFEFDEAKQKGMEAFLSYLG